MLTFSRFARAVNAFTASPQATGCAFVLILMWAVTGPLFHFSEIWQIVINTITSVITFLMVFVLNNAQSRDTAAMNPKLDALIFHNEKADNALVGLERKSDSEAQAARQIMTDAVQGA